MDGSGGLRVRVERRIRAGRIVGRLRSTVWLVVVALVVAAGVQFAPSAHADALSAPPIRGPVNRTSTTISVVIDRVAESMGVCQPDIGYEFKGGAYADWYDHGGFPNAPCDDPDPGFKFSGLAPGTTYTLSVRAYRIVDGAKTDFSPASSVTGTTLGDPAPSPSPSPTPSPSPSPSPTPTASPTPTPTPEPTTNPQGISALSLTGPTNLTTSSISVKLYRSPESGGVCRPDIGYEFSSGGAWSDVGGFSSVCDRNYAGYKFSGLASGTSYTLRARAYRLAEGVKTYSPEAQLVASTSGDPAPSPTPSPSPTPTIEPSPTPTIEPSPTPTVEPSPTPTVEPSGISAPGLTGPTNRTSSTISVKLFRSPESGGVCQPDIGYEFSSGGAWVDAGGFTSVCDRNYAGYKFSGLAPSTVYVLQARAYRLVGGVKTYSTVAELVASTL
ncbi:hypothetical protein SAMN04488242_2640 [Tessaracoccus oleiagri]|uniref:Fibronectin type-III domain-containing protein n=1 Tax=Tessaracoccus oleiagri TaxID=686624 RepID=A0A1G9MHR5_9ACTN|nr:hypothetical protein SAMN04488242_2640 [Tessaracoccus oleiagri]